MKSKFESHRSFVNIVVYIQARYQQGQIKTEGPIWFENVEYVTGEAKIQRDAWVIMI